jgi:hypothetical protein
MIIIKRSNISYFLIFLLFINILTKISSADSNNNPDLKSNITYNYNNNTNLTLEIDISKLKSNSNVKKNFNIWGDYLNLPELLIYYYNQTEQNNQFKLKIKNKNSLYLDDNNILDISPPLQISKNKYYRKLQITLPDNYLNYSKCDSYKLTDFSYVTLKNCSFEIYDSNDNLLWNFDMILLNMILGETKINQIIIENSNKENKQILTTPSFIENKVNYTECKEILCSELKDKDKLNKTLINDNYYEPLFNNFNFQINFFDLKEYQFELFRVFMIVRNNNYILEKKRNENSISAKFKSIEDKNNNEISFFSDITKLISINDNNYQINLETFPEKFDLKLIFDVQRINYNIDQIEDLNIENSIKVSLIFFIKFLF